MHASCRLPKSFKTDFLCGLVLSIDHTGDCDGVAWDDSDTFSWGVGGKDEGAVGRYGGMVKPGKHGA